MIGKIANNCIIGIQNSREPVNEFYIYSYMIITLSQLWTEVKAIVLFSPSITVCEQNDRQSHTLKDISVNSFWVK